MSGDRVILAVKFTPAGGAAAIRKVVGGFLRYVQYRDKHPDSKPTESAELGSVSGLLKYVAYRDRATDQGRLFGPDGPAKDAERRAFATYVADSLAATRPQPGPDGVDRRRAVYRFVLSPERAEGLDLRQLTSAAMTRLEVEAKSSGLHWIAAEHRNTAYPHVHIVLAGMREESGDGGYRGLVLTKARLAAMKQELALEIVRQRGRESRQDPGAERRTSRPIPAEAWLRRQPRTARPRALLPTLSFIQLQSVAARYRRYLERELEEDRRERERYREWSR